VTKRCGKDGKSQQMVKRKINCLSGKNARNRFEKDQEKSTRILLLKKRKGHQKPHFQGTLRVSKFKFKFICGSSEDVKQKNSQRNALEYKGRVTIQIAISSNQLLL
ncbi:MAG: hypothetical protein GY823_13920, partial [Flavobacteriaceae bacterium]|nr:hypothetical protein [Flavobacteriaceae bacterium]